jgi:protoporphyrinogen oxidase
MGLAAGALLADRGWRVLVFEADDRIGGMSAHFDFDGLDVERYYHFLCKGDRPLLDLLADLGLSGRVRWDVTRMGFFYEGTLYEWGRPDALLRFPHLGRREKLRYALHVLRARLIHDWEDLDQVEATGWIRRWIGDRAYDMLWAKSFELKFYEHHDQISAAWIATRIRRVSLSRRDAFHEEMGYLEGGSSVLLEALRARIERAGGEVALKAPVERVLSEGGRVTGVRVAGVDRWVDQVVSTVPLLFVPSLVPQLSQAELDRIRAIQNIGVVCVKLKLPERFTPYFWINVNDARIEVPGVIEYTNLNPLAAHVVYVPYYLPPSHPKWRWEAQQFVEEALRVLQTLRPGWDPRSVLATHVSRYRYAQPICTPGFRDRLPSLRTSIDGFVMADTSSCYPEDRSISESVKIARQLVDAVGAR